MATLVCIALVCIFLYAAYLVFGPFSYRCDSFADTGVNVAAFLLWITLSAVIATQIVPDQATLFATTVYLIAAIIGIMIAMFLALFVSWILWFWVNWTLIPAIERLFQKKK